MGTRGFLLLMIAMAARADILDDAVAALAKKVVARLATSETARVTSRNISSLPAADAAKAQTALTRALQRRPRNPRQVEVALTISENLRGYLLVAEIRHENETMIEMTEFRIAAASAQAPAAFRMESKLLWEQELPILDVTVLPDYLRVLDTAGLAPSAEGSRLSVTAGQLNTTDGPFTEAKEMISYALYDVRGKAEVEEWTARFMQAHRDLWPGWEGEAEIWRAFGPEDFAPPSS